MNEHQDSCMQRCVRTSAGVFQLNKTCFKGVLIMTKKLSDRKVSEVSDVTEVEENRDKIKSQIHVDHNIQCEEYHPQQVHTIHLFVWFLWHINLCRLFNAKSFL